VQEAELALTLLAYVGNALFALLLPQIGLPLPIANAPPSEKRDHMSARRRLVLGVKFGPPIVVVWFMLGGLLVWWVSRVVRAPTRIPGTFIGPLLASVATSLLFRARWLLGCAVEMDSNNIRIRSYGYLWPSKLIPLSSVLSVAPWGEDEPQHEQYRAERAPRLFFSLTDQRYFLLGPWNTPDADGDYARIRDFFGPLFIGDGRLRR
jgi:hypothetical protein